MWFIKYNSWNILYLFLNENKCVSWNCYFCKKKSMFVTTALSSISKIFIYSKWLWHGLPFSYMQVFDFVFYFLISNNYGYLWTELEAILYS